MISKELVAAVTPPKHVNFFDPSLRDDVTAIRKDDNVMASISTILKGIN